MATTDHSGHDITHEPKVWIVTLSLYLILRSDTVTARSRGLCLPLCYSAAATKFLFQPACFSLLLSPTLILQSTLH